MIPLTIHCCNLTDFGVLLFISLRQNMDSKSVKVYDFISDEYLTYEKYLMQNMNIFLCKTIETPAPISDPLFPSMARPSWWDDKEGRKKVFRKTLWNSELVVKGSSKFWVNRFMLALMMLSWLGGSCLLSQNGHLAFHFLERKRNKTKRQLILEVLKEKNIREK